MATIVYNPMSGDPEQTSVCDGRFRFKAFEPTEMPDDGPWQHITEKLKDNPAFGDSLNEERKAQWDAWLISKRSA
jgi:hypothetical protein